MSRRPSLGHPLVVLLLVVLVLPVPAFAAPAAAVEPERGARERRALLDLSADVLPANESQVGLFWAFYARGFGSGLQVSTHAAADVVGVLNASARYALLRRPELRLAVDAGFLWPVILPSLAQLVGTEPMHVLSLPLALRATVPLDDDVELNLAASYRWTGTFLEGAAMSDAALRSEVSLVRHDRAGAFALVGMFPLLNYSSVRVSVPGLRDISGGLLLDELASWGVLLARDHHLGKSGHLRLGLGYRNRPGILFLESLGHVLISFDLYWR